MYKTFSRRVRKSRLGFITIISIILGTCAGDGKRIAKVSPANANSDSIKNLHKDRANGYVDIDGVSLKVPRDLEVQRPANTPDDFELLIFFRGDLAILNVYFGNAPSFPSSSCGSMAIKEIKVAGFSASEVACKADSTTMLLREILVELNRTGHWPRFVHFLQADREHETGNAIIESLQVHQPISE